MKAARAVLLAVASTLLAGCATPQPTLPWPEALHADGVPGRPSGALRRGGQSLAPACAPAHRHHGGTCPD